MDVDMWLHPANQRNIELLKSAGNHIIEVEDGELASGLIGKGRLAEPETIVQQLNNHFWEAKSEQNGKYYPLRNKKVIITGGPTYEPIDPVRFVGNRSSGKMGIAIAEAAAEQGAFVTLVLGPSSLTSHHERVRIIRVETAEQMFQATTTEFTDADVAILSAAVSDYTPIDVSNVKIKKKGDTLQLQLTKTKDILATLGQRKKAHQLLVGFALETNNELAHATEKLTKKNLDFIVLNSLRDKGAGFKHDTNKITILDKNNNIEKFELKSKQAVAIDIMAKVAQMIYEEITVSS